MLGRSALLLAATAFHPFFSVFGHAPPSTALARHVARAAHDRRRASRASAQPRKQSAGRQCHQPKHQMAHHFARGPRAGLGGPPKPLSDIIPGISGGKKCAQRGFRRAAENCTPAACAPRHTPVRPSPISDFGFSLQVWVCRLTGPREELLPVEESLRESKCVKGSQVPPNRAPVANRAVKWLLPAPCFPNADSLSQPGRHNRLATSRNPEVHTVAPYPECF
jgi:hypothetical protein